MIFDFDEYYTSLVSFPIWNFFRLLIIVALTFVYLYFKAKKTKSDVKFVKYILYFVAALPVILWLSLFNVNWKFIHQTESDAMTLHGEITNVQSEMIGYRMTYDDQLAHPHSITINNQEYYMMEIGDFQVGDIVEISYLPESYIVLEIQYYTEDSLSFYEHTGDVVLTWLSGIEKRETNLYLSTRIFM